jgi:predicted acylesterase/phospholipase RssA
MSFNAETRPFTQTTSVKKDSTVACNCACDRDRHLFCPGPKRMLALDGGGVRGAITVAFLEEIEAVLSTHPNKPVHLGNWFDLIGGTSTGAIIAGALAMGYTIADIKRFYFELAPKVFKRPFWRVLGLQAKYDARTLRAEIENIVETRALDSEDLITGFCLVSKRIDTGSPWVLANNPRSLYWETKSARKHGGAVLLRPGDPSDRRR